MKLENAHKVLSAQNETLQRLLISLGAKPEADGTYSLDARLGYHLSEYLSSGELLVQVEHDDDQVRPDADTLSDAAAYLAESNDVSSRAIRFTMRLSPQDARTAAQHLYAYNRKAVTPSLRDSFPNRGAIETLLGNSGNGLTIDGKYRILRPGKNDEYWIYLEACGHELQLRPHRHKLYICPDTVALSSSFPALTSFLAESVAPQLKLGASAYGLSRPDKIIAYFECSASLRRAVGLLMREFAGIPSQPTPFTTPETNDGLVSSAIDPPCFPNTEALSWREYICGVVTKSLLFAQKFNSYDSTFAFMSISRALLSLGIDPRTWAAPSWFNEVDR